MPEDEENIWLLMKMRGFFFGNKGKKERNFYYDKEIIYFRISHRRSSG